MADEAEGSSRRRVASSVLARGAAYTAMAAVARSLVPFAVNLCVTRKLTPEQFRLPAVHFHLITMSVLLLSREGVRRACVRHAAADEDAAASERGPDTGAATTPTRRSVRLEARRRRGAATDGDRAGEGDGDSGDRARRRRRDMQIIVNTSWISVPLSVVVACAVCIGFAILHPRADDGGGAAGAPGRPSNAVDEYAFAVALQGLAAVIEVLSEPLQALARFKLQFYIFAASETAAAFAGATTTAVLVLTTDAGATIFGYSRVATACVGAAVLLANHVLGPGEGAAAGWRAPGARLRARVLELLPRRIDRGAVFFDARLLKLTLDYSVQAAEKLVLGEGEKVVLASMATGYNQGVFGLVSNLGSLAVRLLFFPLEQAAFIAFGMSGGASSSSSSGPAAPSAASRAKRLDAYQVLVHSLRLAVAIGLVFLCFGPPYSYTLVRILYGRAWARTEAPAVLGAYCYYVALLAVNGISEAFVHATASSSQLWYSNAWMLLVSCVSMCASVNLIGRGGAAGLVVSNCVNVLLRIGYSLQYIRSYRREQLGADCAPLAAAAPSAYALPILAAVRVAAGRTGALVHDGAEGARFVRGAAVHVSVGAVGLCCFVLCLLCTDDSPAAAALRSRLASVVRRARRPGVRGAGREKRE